MWIGDDIEDLAQIGDSIHLAIGVFDGLHLGHRAVLDLAKSGARQLGGQPVVLTFDPHPAAILRPGAAPALLTCRQQKLRLFREAGVRHVLMLRFDTAMAALSAEQFLEAILEAASRLRTVAVGFDWRFGANRAGDVALLRAFSIERGFEVAVAGPVCVDGETVSSTAIRGAVASGDLRKASRFLGRNFSIYGNVIHGAGRGREIGFPTANIEPVNGLLPPDGVYAATVLADDQRIPAVLNLGTRPTVEQAGKRTLEVHLLGYSGDLYGSEIEVAFDAFLRPERRFDTMEALRRQIAEDVSAARRWFPSDAATASL